MASEVVRFKKVLHVREVERTVTQSELAEKMNQEREIQERVCEMETLHESALDDFCAHADELLSPQQLWFERQNLDAMEKDLDFGKKQLEFCRNEIEEKKVVLVEKHRNVQLMEKYVDKLKERANKKMLDAEQNNLDDITSMRYLRTVRGGGPI